MENRFYRTNPCSSHDPPSADVSMFHSSRLEAHSSKLFNMLVYTQNLIFDALTTIAATGPLLH
jgi:hypothetical protein